MIIRVFYCATLCETILWLNSMGIGSVHSSLFDSCEWLYSRALSIFWYFYCACARVVNIPSSYFERFPIFVDPLIFRDQSIEFSQYVNKFIRQWPQSPHSALLLNKLLTSKQTHLHRPTLNRISSGRPYIVMLSLSSVWSTDGKAESSIDGNEFWLVLRVQQWHNTVLVRTLSKNNRYRREFRVFVFTHCLYLVHSIVLFKFTNFSKKKFLKFSNVILVQFSRDHFDWFLYFWFRKFRM